MTDTKEIWIGYGYEQAENKFKDKIEELKEKLQQKSFVVDQINGERVEYIRWDVFIKIFNEIFKNNSPQKSVRARGLRASTEKVTTSAGIEPEDNSKSESKPIEIDSGSNSHPSQSRSSERKKDDKVNSKSFVKFPSGSDSNSEICSNCGKTSGTNSHPCQRDGSKTDDKKKKNSKKNFLFFPTSGSDTSNSPQKKGCGRLYDFNSKHCGTDGLCPECQRGKK